MQAALAGDPQHRRGAAHAVALGIEGRSPGGDAQTSGSRRDDRAGNAALGRQPAVEEEPSRSVVQAARRHQGQHVTRDLRRVDPFAAERVQTCVGQRCAHHRQVGGGDQQRALLEVEVEDLVRRVIEGTGVAQQMGHRPVAVAGLPLREVGREVDPVELAAGQAVEQLLQFGQAPIPGERTEQAGDADRAGVDHRVVGPARRGLELDHRVEGLAGRFDTDLGMDRLHAEALEGQTVDERLGHGLQGELGARVAGRGPPAIDGAQRRREALRIDPAQLGDVTGDPPPAAP